MDATKPTKAERYASLKFRRAAVFLDHKALSHDDVMELCAFIRVVGMRSASMIFQGKKPWWVNKAWQLMAYTHRVDGLLLEAMVERNRAEGDVDDALAIMEALRAGGFQTGRVPNIVRQAMLEKLGDGHSQRDVALMFGTNREHVRVICGLKGKAPHVDVLGVTPGAQPIGLLIG